MHHALAVCAPAGAPIDRVDGRRVRRRRTRISSGVVTFRCWVTKNAATVAIASATNAATGSRLTAVPPPRSGPRSRGRRRARGGRRRTASRGCCRRGRRRAPVAPGGVDLGQRLGDPLLLLEQRLAAREAEVRAGARARRRRARARRARSRRTRWPSQRPRLPSRRRASSTGREPDAARRRSRPSRAPGSGRRPTARRSRPGGCSDRRPPATCRASSAAWRAAGVVQRRVGEALEAQRLEVVVRLAVAGEHDSAETGRTRRRRRLTPGGSTSSSSRRPPCPSAGRRGWSRARARPRG